MARYHGLVARHHVLAGAQCVAGDAVRGLGVVYHLHHQADVRVVHYVGGVGGEQFGRHLHLAWLVKAAHADALHGGVCVAGTRHHFVKCLAYRAEAYKSYIDLFHYLVFSVLRKV